jgi:hypothetical protein
MLLHHHYQHPPLMGVLLAALTSATGCSTEPCRRRSRPSSSTGVCESESGSLSCAHTVQGVLCLLQMRSIACFGGCRSALPSPLLFIFLFATAESVVHAPTAAVTALCCACSVDDNHDGVLERSEIRYAHRAHRWRRAVASCIPALHLLQPRTHTQASAHNGVS